jgi:hypothetical protein
MTPSHPGAEERERGLERVRKLTVAAAALGVTLGAATAGVAAVTLPGRSTQGGGSGTQAPADGGGGQAQQQQDGLQPPDQAPQAPQDQGPLVITGSS